MFLRSFKEINRFVSKWVWNIYLNISYWAKLTFSKLRFFKFKIFVFSSVFGAFQLTQISLNFYSWFNLKSTFFLLNIKANFNKKTESETENPTHGFRETILVLHLIQESQNQIQWWVGARKRKSALFLKSFCHKEILVAFVFYLNV